MKQLSLFLILILLSITLFSCEKDDPNDTIMQAKAERVIGTWTVDKVNFGKALPDSLKNMGNRLDFIIPSCSSYKANKNNMGFSSLGCNGQIEFPNNGIFTLTNSWFFNDGLYRLHIFNPSGVLNITSAQQRTMEKLSVLFSGIYKVEISDNELIYTQVSSNWSPTYFYGVSFTAKRVK
jgi:hypothetical protein